MKFPKLKAITAATIMVAVSNGQVLAEETAAANAAGNNAAPQTQAPAANAPAYPPPYQGYRPYRYNYNRGWSRPFGNDGPSFRGPWNRGSGFGFGSGNSPGWDSGPRYYDRPNYRPDYRPDYRPRDGYYQRPYGPRPYYDRGPRFSGPDWDDGGMSFGW